MPILLALILGLFSALRACLLAWRPSALKQGALYALSAAILLVPLRGELAEGLAVIGSQGAPHLTLFSEGRLAPPLVWRQRPVVWLSLESDPSGARLYVAGRFVGRTPSHLPVAAGERVEYAVIAPSANYRSFRGSYRPLADTALFVWLDRRAPGGP